MSFIIGEAKETILSFSQETVKKYCNFINFRFCACFEQGVPWHSGNYRVWIHSETCTWHENNTQSHCHSEFKFNGVYSRNILLEIKDGAYVANLDEFKSIGTRWIALDGKGNNATYFDSFGVQYIQKEIKKLMGNKNIITNIYRIQAYDLIMLGYFCIGFINFMLKVKNLLDY